MYAEKHNGQIVHYVGVNESYFGFKVHPDKFIINSLVEVKEKHSITLVSTDDQGCSISIRIRHEQVLSSHPK